MAGAMRSTVSVVCLLSVSLSLAQGQQQTASTQPDKKIAEHAEKMRRNIEQKGVGHQVTIITKDGAEFHGAISEITDQDFRVAEIDMKQIVPFRYEDVKKIYGEFTQGHPVFGRNPRRNTIIAACVLGFLGVFLGVTMSQIK
jgi:hypothetical protein